MQLPQQIAPVEADGFLQVLGAHRANLDVFMVVGQGGLDVGFKGMDVQPGSVLRVDPHVLVADVRTVTRTVSDGALAIEFTSDVNDPLISAIEVIRVE